MIYNFSKRFFDIISSGIAILILSPLLIPIIIGLKFTGEGYIFYKQARVGYKKKPFYILKFATMLKDSPNLPGGLITTKKDPRITPMGGFLRKSKINELPQLFNIFFGSMSVVGPRPLVKDIFLYYSKEYRDKIYNVKPGLTGIGSIIFREEESIISSIKLEDPFDYYKRVISPYKGKLEIWYQQNRSFILDIKLIFLTVWVVIFPKTRIYDHWFKDLPKRNF